MSLLMAITHIEQGIAAINKWPVLHVIVLPIQIKNAIHITARTVQLQLP